MTTDKEVNYTPEMVEFMRTAYLDNPTRDTVEMLSEKYGKSIRSIVGKLTKEGIYKRPSYRTKRGETPCSKEQLVGMIATAIGEEVEQFDGLEKAPKLVLRKILEALDPEALDFLKK